MSLDGEELWASEVIDQHAKRPVRLVSYSVIDYDYSCNVGVDQDIGCEDLIAFCARVSNPSNQNNVQTSEKLIQYLVRNKHWSPFEMVNACLEITTTRDIARQILRHRSFSFQEFSQRYANPVDELSFVQREARLQDMKNRQNSIEINDETLHSNWKMFQDEIIGYAKHAYEWAINNGIAKEVARSVLPEGLVLSKMYMNGSIRSWIHYIEVRSDPSTQKEHRIIAQQCAYELAGIIPNISKQLIKA